MRSDLLPVLLASWTIFLVGSARATELGSRGEEDSDKGVETESARHQLIADIDHVVKCRRVPGNM